MVPYFIALGTVSISVLRLKIIIIAASMSLYYAELIRVLGSMIGHIHIYSTFVAVCLIELPFHFNLCFILYKYPKEHCLAASKPAPAKLAQTLYIACRTGSI